MRVAVGTHITVRPRTEPVHTFAGGRVSCVARGEENLCFWRDAILPAQAFAFCADSRLLQATNAWNAAEGFVEGNNLSSTGFKGNLGNEVIGKPRRPFSGCLQSSQSDRR